MSETEIVVSDREFWALGAAFLAVAMAVGLLVIVLIVLAGNQKDLERQARIAVATEHAVCVYRANLIEQARETQHYLLQHPQGAPALGLSAAQLQQTLERQRAAAASLSELQC